MISDQTHVPEAITGLLALFAADLAQVRFGDLDRAALEKAAAAVEAAGAELAVAEEAAVAARAALEATQEDLLQKGQRALAYARIYAEGSPALMERLETIALVRAPRPMEASATGAPGVSSRRRGRPPKTANEATGRLPLEAAVAQPADALSDSDPREESAALSM